MEFNILKLAFLLGYLSLLVCVVSGIPFLTALFRSVLVTVIFSLLGFFVRLYLLRLVGSIENRAVSEYDSSSNARMNENDTEQDEGGEEGREYESPVSKGGAQE